MKKYSVNYKESGISVEYFESKEEAESKAKQMQNHHGAEFVVVEVFV